MKEWFALRFGALAGSSVGIYYVLNYILNLYFSALNLPVYTWMAISMVWVVGLFIVRWQFNNGVSEGDTPNKPKFDFRKFLNQERNSENPGKEKTLFEQAEGEKLNPETEPGPNEIRELGTEKEVGLTKLVEGIVGNSLADAELSLDLELPEGTELKIHGQQYTVKKGSVKIRPKKSQSEKLKKMFPHDKTRKRLA